MALTLFSAATYTAINRSLFRIERLIFPGENGVNLPNSLTLLRIFIVPLLVVVLLTPFFENWFGLPRHIFGVALFLGAALTDYLDGHFARSRNQVTRLGQLLDPIADKLLISAALISLVENQLAPAWAVVIIIGREFAVTGLRSIAAADGVVELEEDLFALAANHVISPVLQGLFRHRRGMQAAGDHDAIGIELLEPIHIERRLWRIGTTTRRPK